MNSKAPGIFRCASGRERGRSASGRLWMQRANLKNFQARFFLFLVQSVFFSSPSLFLEDAMWRFVIQLGSCQQCFVFGYKNQCFDHQGNELQTCPNAEVYRPFDAFCVRLPFTDFSGEGAICQGIKCLQTNYAQPLYCETAGVGGKRSQVKRGKWKLPRHVSKRPEKPFIKHSGDFF